MFSELFFFLKQPPFISSRLCRSEICAQCDWLPCSGSHSIRWRWTRCVPSGGSGEGSLPSSPVLSFEFSSRCRRTEALILLLAACWGQRSSPRRCLWFLAIQPPPPPRPLSSLLSPQGSGPWGVLTRLSLAHPKQPLFHRIFNDDSHKKETV